MAELTTDDGSTASPEAIRRFEEEGNNAMPDQTTDHLSEAVEAAATLMTRAFGLGYSPTEDSGARRLALRVIKVVEPFFATYYEDKGRKAAERRAIEAEQERDSYRDLYGRCERKQAVVAAERDVAIEALRVIDGPADSGPSISVYREAGGGYEGLQAIARAALEHLAALADSDPPEEPQGAVAAAEEKGRSEERERLRPAIEELKWIAQAYGPESPITAGDHARGALASLDTDQESQNG